jgi:hypothetical protein
MFVEVDPEGVAAVSAAGDDDDAGGQEEGEGDGHHRQELGMASRRFASGSRRTPAGPRAIERHGPHGGGGPTCRRGFLFIYHVIQSSSSV